MNAGDHKPLVRLHGAIKTPPFSPRARQCHELRIIDGGNTWRIVYRIDRDAILLLDVFSKRPGKRPNA